MPPGEIHLIVPPGDTSHSATKGNTSHSDGVQNRSPDFAFALTVLMRDSGLPSH